MPTECPGNGTWQDQCAVLSYRSPGSPGSPAPCAYTCSCVLSKDIFALGRSFHDSLTARSIALHHRHKHQSLRTVVCTRGFCAVELYKLLLAYHDCRGICSSTSPSPSCHAMPCHTPWPRRPPSQFKPPVLRFPCETCHVRGNESINPHLHLPVSYTASTNYACLAIDE